MKFLVKSIKLEEAKNITRRFGYALIFDRRSGQESLVRRLSGEHYPRFHLYIDENNQGCIFSLHLDQKKASYEGQHMHSAEYDGDLVEGEISALVSFFSGQYDVSPLGFKNKIEKEVVGCVESQDVDFKNKPDSLREDILDDMEIADLERDIENFNKNVKKKRFLFI
jgi:hypothetical protein